jgi:urease accessory protein
MPSTMAMLTEAGLLRLLTWLSPAYPLGAFSYSHGLEFAVEEGLVRDRATLEEWIATVIAAGAGRSDAALFAAAWRAVGDELCDIIALAAAWRGAGELALESMAQGAAFLATTRAAWPHPALDALPSPVALPVAVAAACAAHGVPLQPAVLGYLNAFAANLVSAGVRLVPLGQTDGQRVLAALAPVVAATTQRALATPLDEVGTAAPMLDWCAMRHETQYTRLFRS